MLLTRMEENARQENARQAYKQTLTRKTDKKKQGNTSDTSKQHGHGEREHQQQ